MNVKPIKNEQAHEWCLYKHYAKRIPSISYAYGLFDQEELIGIITYGMPPSPPLCVGVCGPENKDYVIELNRLCINDGSPKNSASILVSHSLKLLPPSIVVSFADTGVNHVGYIYQATNFIYTGLSAKRTDVFTGNGKHPRHCAGFDKSIRIDRSRKHRYIYFVGSKSQKKQWLKNLSYPILS